MGGNKARKLEYLIPHALSLGCTAIVTSGSAQSNSIRQSAAACAVYGLRCEAVVMDFPYDQQAGKPEGVPLNSEGGNRLLSEMAGAKIHHLPDGPWEVLFEAAENLARELEAEGEVVYRLPVGGSSGVGSYAFYVAAKEILEQGPEFDVVITPSSSGGTHVGLAAGLKGEKPRLIGISADPEPQLADEFAEIAAELHAVSPDVPLIRREDLELNLDYVGPGYCVPSAAGLEAIRMLWAEEGILLEPIYNGKAFAGMLDLIQSGEISGRILFWHTGGAPAFFALNPEQILPRAVPSQF